MEIKKISQFKSKEKIDGFFLIKSVDCKVTSNNKPYMDFTLVDDTGDINAKLWDASKDNRESLVENKLIKVRAEVLQWQGSLQLRIEKVRLVNDEDNVKLEDFVPSAPYSNEEMFNTIMDYANNIQNNDMRNIVLTIIQENKEQMFYYPAAKSNHHSVRGGLLYHISTMLKAGDKLSQVYTFLNKDLLFTGIILHDIAKIDEMITSEIGLVTEYSIEGNLLGHIIQGIKKIDEVGNRLNADKEIIMLIEHMILSHHYEPEYGSPKKPLFPEAEILHILDKMDATMYDMHKALSSTSKGEFTDNIWSLEKRRIYNPNI